MQNLNMRGLLLSLCLGVSALSMTPHNALAQNTKQAEFNAEFERASGLIEYGNDRIAEGYEAYNLGRYGLACDHFTKAQPALVKASRIYESMLLSAKLSANARDYITTIERNLNETIANLNTRRVDACSRG